MLDWGGWKICLSQQSASSIGQQQIHTQKCIGIGKEYILLSPSALIPPFALSPLPFTFLYQPLFFAMNKTITVYSFLAIPGFISLLYSSSAVIFVLFFFPRLHGGSLPDGSAEQRKQQMLHDLIIMFSNFVPRPPFFFVMSPSIHFVLNMRFVWSCITQASQSRRTQGGWDLTVFMWKLGYFFHL